MSMGVVYLACVCVRVYACVCVYMSVSRVSAGFRVPLLITGESFSLI